VVPELEAMGLIGGIDVGVLEAYCLSYARWRDAEARLEAEGLVVHGHRGITRKHPAAQLAREYREGMIALARQLGLTPASRQGLELPPPPPDEDSPFD
jgi:P27 family predicted phage terminase small subunit